MAKVNTRNTRTRSEIYSKLTIKTPYSNVSIVNFEQVSADWVNSKYLRILRKLWSLENLLTKAIAESKCNYYSRMSDKLKIHRKVQKPLGLVKKIPKQQKDTSHSTLFSTIMSLWLNYKKTDFFNSFFAKQCFLIKNISKLPSKFTYMTENALTLLAFQMTKSVVSYEV